MTLEQITAEYRRLDAMLGVDTGSIPLSFSKRMTRQYGVCVFRQDRPVAIRLADFLRSEPELLMQTALHEYAHAAAALLTGVRHGHDRAWKSVCLRIGCAPERLAAPCEAALARRSSRIRYEVVCRRCGASAQYQKRGTVVRAAESGSGSLRCRRCGGSDFQLLTAAPQDAAAILRK